jgi:hypothetical protein
VLAKILTHELEVLRDAANRSDPLDETVLCLLECAARAAEAAARVRTGPPADEASAALRDALAAARAAVVSASHAVVERG